MHDRGSCFIGSFTETFCTHGSARMPERLKIRSSAIRRNLSAVDKIPIRRGKRESVGVRFSQMRTKQADTQVFRIRYVSAARTQPLFKQVGCTRIVSETYKSRAPLFSPARSCR